MATLQLTGKGTATLPLTDTPPELIEITSAPGLPGSATPQRELIQVTQALVPIKWFWWFKRELWQVKVTWDVLTPYELQYTYST